MGTLKPDDEVVMGIQAVFKGYQQECQFDLSGVERATADGVSWRMVAACELEKRVVAFLTGQKWKRA